MLYSLLVPASCLLYSPGRVEAGHLIPVVIDERIIGLHSTILLRSKHGTDRASTTTTVLARLCQEERREPKSSG
ncbi:hypothetical protein L873DRAFT_1798996 [Choiromyces venosus 120613-1]|uniref:Uncharacterized protein n=1 Tax=Choiromyces venosus 120613-1 TaxID=1336337 RepID=A0A3N4K231_9PEZI|nr:hypothetical protein L873DRAFT_1798996 [Choiromyces venosus 120613-1]